MNALQKELVEKGLAKPIHQKHRKECGFVAGLIVNGKNLSNGNLMKR